MLMTAAGVNYIQGQVECSCRIHIGHYKVRYLWLSIPRNKSWIEAWLKFKKNIKDFTYLLIIHVSKENLSVLKVRVHIGKL